eukprot:scaffold1074_cov409-Prasinococcus_capsulatus_cf.AAC.2
MEELEIRVLCTVDSGMWSVESEGKTFAEEPTEVSPMLCCVVLNFLEGATSCRWMSSTSFPATMNSLAT